MDTTSLQIEGRDYKNACGQRSEDRQWHFYAFCSQGTKNQNQSLPHQLTIKQAVTALRNAADKQACLVS